MYNDMVKKQIREYVAGIVADMCVESNSIKYCRDFSPIDAVIFEHFTVLLDMFPFIDATQILDTIADSESELSIIREIAFYKYYATLV